MGGYIPGMTDDQLAGYFGPAASMPPPQAPLSTQGPAPAAPAAPSVDLGNYYGPAPDLGTAAFGAPPPSAPTTPGPTTLPGAPPPANYFGPDLGAQAFGPAPTAPPQQPTPSGLDGPIKFGMGLTNQGPMIGPPVAAKGYASLHPKVAGKGGPRGPSDYEKGMAGLRGTYGDDKSALQSGASAEEARADTIAEGAGQIARTKQDDEAIQRVEAANAAQHFADYSAETQKQIDDVRSKTIDPNRAYSDTGSKVTAVLGGVLGGIYQGLNHLSSNPFIDQMNRVIDRDIAAQETDLKTKKEAIGERKGLLAEMRATYKDEALAKIQARNLYYEGAKEELMAQAAQYDSPAIQARADQAITAMTREQTKLDINEAIRKAAAAQAAGAAAEHRRQIDFENALKYQHAQNETLTANANAQKTLKEGDKEHKLAVQHVGDKLEEQDKQGTAIDLDRLHRYLVDPATGLVDHKREIPGVGRLADLRETVAPPLGKGGALDVAGIAGPGGAALRYGSSAIAGLSPEERENKNAFERSFLSFKNLKTGSASSEQEHNRLVNAWQGAKTTEEVAAAVEAAHDFTQHNRDMIRAEDPEATAEFEGNVRTLKAGDRAGAVKREHP